MHNPTPGDRRLVALLTLLVVGVAATWALLTPPLRAPDEPAHLDSVLRLAYGGGWPRPGDAVIAPVVAHARADVALDSDLPGAWLVHPGRLAFADAPIVPAAQRAHVTAANALPDGPPVTPEDVDQMTQHPPLYYAVGAALLHVTGLTHARWDVQLLALRLLDVLLLAPLVPLAAWSALRLTGSRAAGLVAGAFPLLVPQVGHIFGAVNNDALVALVGGAVTALCVRVLTGDRRWGTAVLLGVVLGLGLLTKVMVAFLAPVVVLAYLLAPEGRRSLGRVAAVAGTALAVGGWWWVRNLLVYEAVQPVGLDRVRVEGTPGTFPHFLMVAWRTTALTFFGDFGWVELRTPSAFWLTGAVVVLALAGVAVTARRGWRAGLVLAVLPAALVGGVVLNAWPYYRDHGEVVGIQGRYLFAGLAALAVLVALAVHRLAGGAERRVRVAAPAVLLVGLAVTTYGLALAFRGFYGGPGTSFGQAMARWELLSPVGRGWMVAVPAVTAGVALVVLVLATRAAAVRPRAAA